MSCKDFEQSLALYVYDELPAEELSAWDAHLASCGPCRAALEDAHRLHQLLGRRPTAEPTPQLLAACRIALSEALDQEPERSPWSALFEDWFSIFSPRPAFGAAGIVGVLVLGFSVGWMMRSPRAATIRAGSPAVNSASLLGDARISSISRIAPDPQTGEVRITLDAARRVTFEGSLDDPRIQQLLVTAVKTYDNPGIRRDTLDCLRSRASNPSVRQALLYAMEHDANLGVRLEALDAVRGLDWGPDARMAFLDVLEHETNPGVRGAAVDELVRHADRDVLPTLERLAANDSCRYVRLKCANAVREVGAK